MHLHVEDSPGICALHDCNLLDDGHGLGEVLPMVLQSLHNLLTDAREGLAGLGQW